MPRMLSSPLGRLWRGIATAISFLTFGLGGLLVGGMWPLLTLVVRRPDKRQKLARSIIHHCMRGFVGLMRGLGVLDYRLHDCERLQRPGPGKTHESFQTARMSARYVSTSAAFFCFRRIPPLKDFSPFR